MKTGLFVTPKIITPCTADYRVISAWRVNLIWWCWKLVQWMSVTNSLARRRVQLVRLVLAHQWRWALQFDSFTPWSASMTRSKQSISNVNIRAHSMAPRNLFLFHAALFLTVNYLFPRACGNSSEQGHAFREKYRPWVQDAEAGEGGHVRGQEVPFHWWCFDPRSYPQGMCLEVDVPHKGVWGR